jgi:hypothetical protein
MSELLSPIKELPAFYSLLNAYYVLDNGDRYDVVRKGWINEYGDKIENTIAFSCYCPKKAQKQCDTLNKRMNKLVRDMRSVYCESFAKDGIGDATMVIGENQDTGYVCWQFDMSGKTIGDSISMLDISAEHRVIYILTEPMLKGDINIKIKT